MKKGIALSVLILTAAVSALVLSSCKEEDYIGEIVFEAPVTAVVYESGTDNGEPFSGIVYRKVNDYEKLLARETVPVLVVFLDDAEFSGQAIPFVETLADTYQGRLRVVRVNVMFSDNPPEVAGLISLFGIAEYPSFAFAEHGARVGLIEGYTAASDSTILSMIDRLIG
ncbi:MAG: thioredoxin family protein [Saccharofermentanales bacterium]